MGSQQHGNHCVSCLDSLSFQGVAKIAAGIKVGPGMDPTTQMGPLVSEEQLKTGEYMLLGVHPTALPALHDHCGLACAGCPVGVCVCVCGSVTRYMSQGKQEGACAVTGGDRHGTKGYFVQPTVFTDVRPGMSVVDEEVRVRVWASLRASSRMCDVGAPRH